VHAQHTLPAEQTTVTLVRQHQLLLQLLGTAARLAASITRNITPHHKCEGFLVRLGAC
jgi:hypothetical protein